VQEDDMEVQEEARFVDCDESLGSVDEEVRAKKKRTRPLLSMLYN